MMKMLFKGFLTALLILAPFFSLYAEAALGDFQYKWGAEYNFQMPSSIAVDSSGNMYVAINTSNDNYEPQVSVQVYSNSGALLRKFGTYGSGDGQFTQYPSGIAVDSSGNVYVADTGNHRIQVFSNTGTYLRKWGAYGSGDGQFNSPCDIAVDSGGNVYVVDANSRVQVFSNTGTFLRKWGKEATGDQWYSTRSIAVDSSGNVYVADSYNGKIDVFSNTGTYLRKWGAYGSGDGQFTNPSGIAVDGNGHVFVVDSSLNRVQVFSSTGVLLEKWGKEEGYVFFWPWGGIAVDPSGNVYVADTHYNRIQIFSNEGTLLNKWGPAYTLNGLFSYPSGIATVANGDVYVVDSYANKVQVFSKTGTFLRKWGTFGTGDGQLYYPQGIAIDASGDVYVVDSNNRRVQVFSSTGTFLRKWGTAGSDDGQFNYPQGIVLDKSGNVYVADAYNHRVQVFSRTGAFLRKWGSYGSDDGQFFAPWGIALDASGNVYVTDYSANRVQVFSNAGTFLRKWGTFGFGDGQFRWPRGITVDEGGNVYVADTYNNRVQVFNNTGTFLGKWGEFGSNDGQFVAPYGIAMGSSGNVYVADTENFRVQVFEGNKTCVLTANAGPDQTVEQTSTAGASVILSGSATAQGCADALTYEWSWLGGSATGSSPTVLMPPGTTNPTLTVKSGTQTATDTVAITVHDTRPPETTAFINGTMGNNGWYLSIVGVTLSASDSGSGVKEVRHSIDGVETVTVGSTAAFAVNADGTHSGSYYAKDNAGNSEGAHSLTVNIDKTPPAIAAAQNPPANVNGWNNADVAVSFTCNDATSGIASCAQPVTVSADRQNQAVSGMATDKAGNSAATSVNLNIDKTPPTIAAAQNPSANANGWNNADVAVSFTCNDALSGIENCTQPVTVAADGQNQVVSGTATDKAGNSAATSASLNIDKTPPTIAAAQIPSANVNGWNNMDVVVNFTCIDTLSGIASCTQPVAVAVDGQSQVVSGTATDKADNSAVTSVNLNIDKTPPSIAAAQNPSANANGWNNTDVAVSFTCNDVLSGIANCTQPVTVAAEGQGQAVSGTATDKADNSATTSVSLNIDKTPPAIATTPNPLPNGNGWNNTDVTVGFACSDSMSGVASCPSPATVTTEGGGQVINGTASDAAGNTATTSAVLNVDKTLPTILAAQNPSANPNGWNNTDVVVSFTCTDTLSGIASCAQPVTVAADGQNQTVSGTATDKADNSAATSVNLNIDKTPPTITAVQNPLANVFGWNNSDMTVSFACNDGLSGVASCASPIAVATEGASQVINGMASDVADNTATVSAALNIDKTMPTISAAQNPLPNANGWNNTDVVVSFTCNDALSGIASCTEPVTAAADGHNQAVSGAAADKAGNSAATSVNLNIDKAPPAITITGVANGATYLLGTAPVAGYSVTDVLSGVATQSANLTGGNANGAGTYTYTVTATDKAGNTVSASAVYTVAYAFGGFLPPVSLGKPFKLGSTIPVKFQLTDAYGAYISTASATLMIQKFSGDQPVDEPIEVTSTSGADTGNMFRYSATDNLYIYNLSTDGLSEGTWQVRATLDDGTVKTAFIQLKVK